MARDQSATAIESEATAFYAYLKARLGEARQLSVREASRLYKDYLEDRQEALGTAEASRYISTAEAASVAGVSQQTIRNWVRAGLIPDVQVTSPRGNIRIPADFLMHMDLGIKGNPEFADSAAYVRRVREEHERLSDEEYFAMLDREAGSAE